jgi:hypothetical protein
MQGTPRVLGVAQENATFIYAFEALPAHYRTLDELLKEPDGEQWLTAQVMLRIIGQSQACFDTIDRYPHNYVYTDFTVNNIMLDHSSDALLLIDLDSAWSYAELKKQNGKATSGQFDANYWCLWYEYLLPRQNYSCPSPALLPKTMVLTLGAVWGRALGFLQSGQPSAKEAVNLVREPLHEKQRPLWDALQTRDKAEGKAKFQEYFHLSSRVDELFECWRDVFWELIAGRSVPWVDVRNAVELIARANLRAPIKTAPSRADRELPKISWERARKNVYDPLRVIAIASKLIRTQSTH